MVLPVLKDFDFKEKKVLVRCDLDVPIENGKVVDDLRIRECLPTIQYLLEDGATLILTGHLGRPYGKEVEKLRMSPVAERLGELLKFQLGELGRLGKLGGFEGYKIGENVTLLENLRFDKREEENDEGFAKELANLGEFYFRGVTEETSWPSSKSEDVSCSGETAYVNEAFAASHREHASIVGVPKFLPHCAGFRFVEEVENLSKVLENPKRPLVFVIGGAKPETKLPLIADFTRIADIVLVGGLLAKDEYKKLKIKNKIYISKIKNVVCADLTDDGFDISKESVKKFIEIIKTARMVVWNGPLGKVEEPEGQEGTRRIGKAVGDCRGFRVVGGGDTIAALKKFNLIDKMDYVSTGGGAMLEFLARGSLPGIAAISK